MMIMLRATATLPFVQHRSMPSQLAMMLLKDLP